MIDPRLTPTRLAESRERPRVIVKEPLRHEPFRGLRVIARWLGLMMTLLGLAVRRKLTEHEFGIRLRDTFEDLGGLWVRAGNLLSLRIDVLPGAVSEELAKLQSRNFGFPTQYARRIIEEELGAPIEQYFDEFSDAPFAVAAIAQVHRARLRQEQRYVAVKVQQPYVQAVFVRDLAHIRRAIQVIKLLRIRLHLRWDFAMDEITELMSQELNFHYEASAIRRMRKKLRSQQVYVPELFRRYSTRRVLVTEFVHAALMADVIQLQTEDPARLNAWLNENNIVLRTVARRLINTLLRQTIEHNLYHGNPNPWYIVLLRDSRIAFIDFSTTIFTEREYLEKYRLFLKALATRDYAKAADMCFMLCATLPNFDLEEVKEQLVRSLRTWATRTLVKELPYREKSLDNATIQLIRVLVDYQCTMDWGWLRIRRAVMMLDLSLERLYPEANYTRLLQKYFARAEVRTLDALMGPPLIRRTLTGYVTALDIQDRVNEYTMFQGALVRRHAQVFKGATNKAAAIFATIVMEMALVALLSLMAAALVFLHHRYPERMERIIGPQLSSWAGMVPHIDGPIWAVIFAVLIYLLFTLRVLGRRLREKDVRPHERVAAV
jgi:ubiquinone biosynthesis protein